MDSNSLPRGGYWTIQLILDSEVLDLVLLSQSLCDVLSIMAWKSQLIKLRQSQTPLEWNGKIVHEE